MTRSSLILLAMWVSACGYTSPGGGTGTLFVSAHLSGDGSTSGSRARITVRNGASNGDIVRDAEVAIRGGPLGRTIVPFDDNRDDYRLDGFTWVEGFRLEVIRGRDVLDGSIDAPGATLITNPISDSTFRRADGPPLIIRWKDERGTLARFTTLRLEKANIERNIPEGQLELVVPVDDLRVDNAERVRIERRNEVSLAGGVAGSILSATTDHGVQFRVE